MASRWIKRIIWFLALIGMLAWSGLTIYQQFILDEFGTGKNARQTQALKNGKRAIIALQTGEIIGKKSIQIQEDDEKKTAPELKKKPLKAPNNAAEDHSNSPSESPSESPSSEDSSLNPIDRPVEKTEDSQPETHAPSEDEHTTETNEPTKHSNTDTPPPVTKTEAHTSNEPETTSVETPHHISNTMDDIMDSDDADDTNFIDSEDTTSPSEQEPIADTHHKAEKKTSSNKKRKVKLLPPPNIKTEEKRKRAKISVMITGLGLSELTTARALELDPSFSVGFSPYTLHFDRWSEILEEHKRELYVEIPMEPSDYPINDPGPHALISTLPPNENINRLNWALSQLPWYHGVYSPSDEKFSHSINAIRRTLLELQKHKLIFVYGNIIENNPLLQMAYNIDLPTVSADIQLDDVITPKHISRQLILLEEKARKNGYAVGLAHPYPISIKLLKQWEPTLRERGLMLVPISELFPDG